LEQIKIYNKCYSNHFGKIKILAPNSGYGEADGESDGEADGEADSNKTS
jgi:predicted secreted acid phosphatase